MEFEKEMENFSTFLDDNMVSAHMENTSNGISLILRYEEDLSQKLT